MRNNYPLSENLEKKIKKKLLDIVTDQFKSNITPKKAFIKMSSKFQEDGKINEEDKKESFRGTIDKLLKGSTKIEAVDENFSLHIPMDNKSSNLKQKSKKSKKSSSNEPTPKANSSDDNEDFRKVGSLDYDLESIGITHIQGATLHQTMDKNVSKYNGSQDDTMIETTEKRVHFSRVKDDLNVDYRDNSLTMLNDFSYDQESLNRDPSDIEETPDLIDEIINHKYLPNMKKK
jgi:hypothetical protein